MNEQLLLYISAAADLIGEREVLGRAVAEIPVDLGWRIAQSPRKNEPLDLEAVANADVHLVIMGGDIRAPIGLEWLTARRAGRQPLLFLRKDMSHTLAAVDFIRFVEREERWRPFVDAADLRLQVLNVLANAILDRAGLYHLSVVELERLQGWIADLNARVSAVDEETRGGAGNSSLLLSRERFVPSEGVLLRPDDELEQGPDRS